jgi:hypothetical protein
MNWAALSPLLLLLCIGQPKLRRLFGIFLLECAKETIPNDQEGTKVPINAIGIPAMVDPMEGRSVQEEAKWAQRTQQL